MISWNSAKKISPNEFARQLKDDYLHATGNELTYKYLAKITYRSHSSVQTWLSPNSTDPLPIHARHHMWLAVNLEIGRKYREWTDVDNNFIRENYGKISTEMVAEQLGRSVPAVHQRAVSIGVSAGKNERKAFSAEEIKMLKNPALSDKQIAEKTGRHASAINRKRQSIRAKK